MKPLFYLGIFFIAIGLIKLIVYFVLKYRRGKDAEK